MQEDYTGDFATRRSIISTFSFTAKTFICGPETTYGPIQGVTVDIMDGFTCGSSVLDPFDMRTEVTGDYPSGERGIPTHEIP